MVISLGIPISEYLWYHILSVIYGRFFSFPQNNLKDLDPSYKMDLDL